MWFVSGSAGFINLGVQRGEPQGALAALVESVPVPDSLDAFTDDQEERLLKAAYRMRVLMDKWTGGGLVFP